MRARHLTWVLAATLLSFALGAGARAEEPKRVSIGLYTPSAPFDGPEARLGFVTALAEHIQAKTGRQVVGRVFARAADLTAAVKKGEVQFVVIDAPNAAALALPYAVLGAAVRGNTTVATWELVAGDAVKGIRDLRGKTVVVPTVSGRESAFLLNAMLEGELQSGYFAKIISAPDALSATAALGLGRADAAVVPGGLALPAGTHRVLTLREVPWPMFAAAPGVDDATRKAFAGALASFRASGTFVRFDAPGGADYPALARAFSVGARRGPMAVPPPARLEVKGVLAGRSFVIDESDLSGLVEAPRRK
jgi:ABC-type amino acid transport substrate-binding protein